MKEKDEEESQSRADIISREITETGELDSLILLAADKNKNTFLNITQGGASRQQKVLRTLKERDPELYKLYKKMLENDELDYIKSKITFYLKRSGASKKS